MIAVEGRHGTVDDDEVPTALRLEEYDGEDDCAWLLLDAGRGPGVRGLVS